MVRSSEAPLYAYSNTLKHENKTVIATMSARGCCCWTREIIASYIIIASRVNPHSPLTTHHSPLPLNPCTAHLFRRSRVLVFRCLLVLMLLLGMAMSVGVWAQQFCGLAPIFRLPHKSMQRISVFSYGTLLV